ncbi:hypothetical protein SO802_014269 [Lithocarpus litseifolius]|uniref:Disease resistance R13L4/SHOC-2-like LRR domain-containing protein n=1 Tax=Lithocarpus litseifolius TaxID=425828 RepID=A0AAW2CSR4_9ROSI
MEFSHQDRDSGLCKLRYLAVYNLNGDIKFNIDNRRGVKIENGIGHLESLQKLYEIEATSATLITELGSLAQLRKLSISKLKKENGLDLCIAIQKMNHLRSIEIKATSEEEVLNLQSLPSPPPFLQTLSLLGQLEKLPQWIPKVKSIARFALCWSRLMEDPLKVLQTLPEFDESLASRWIQRLIIDEGALPLLEMLVIGDCPSGIHHLKSLKNLQFEEMPTKFVLSLQPNEGLDFGKVKHIPFVTFKNRVRVEHYKRYKLGDSNLLNFMEDQSVHTTFRKLQKPHAFLLLTPTPSMAIQITLTATHSTNFCQAHLNILEGRILCHFIVQVALTASQA